MFVRKELDLLKVMIGTFAPPRPLSKHARCHWGISEAMRLRRLDDCVLPPK
jgi:hypothetical protein